MAEPATTNGSNGHKKGSGKVRVAIVGVGNCASALVQGVHYYRDAKPDEFVPGLMHVDLGGYHISDIEFSAAFDVDADKVGRDLGEAIGRGQNNTVRFCDVPEMGVPVHRGMTHDGIGKYLSTVIKKSPGETADVVQVLKDTHTDVVVSYLPVGSEQATKWYVEQVLQAGCAFVNCMPVFIAREPYWQRRFEQRGLPIVGDDIKSQVGATIVHRQLDAALRRSRRAPRAHAPAERRRQHRLHEHARARAARVEEDLEDQRRHVAARLRHRRPQRAHRPERLRPVARRSQVGVHPHGGPQLRRRAPEHRDEARGGRLAELGRHRDRRGPLRQARPRQRPLRCARVAERRTS